MPSSGGKTCARSEEHTSELQSHDNLVCRLLLEKKNRHRRTVLSPSVPVPAPHAPRAQAPAARALAAGGVESPVGREPSPPAPFFFFFNGTGAPRNHRLSLPGPFPI